MSRWSDEDLRAVERQIDSGALTGRMLYLTLRSIRDRFPAPELARLISDAAEAVERFGEDALEAHAREEVTRLETILRAEINFYRHILDMIARDTAKTLVADSQVDPATVCLHTAALSRGALATGAAMSAKASS